MIENDEKHDNAAQDIAKYFATSFQSILKFPEYGMFRSLR